MFTIDFKLFDVMVEPDNASIIRANRSYRDQISLELDTDMSVKY